MSRSGEAGTADSDGGQRGAPFVGPGEALDVGGLPALAHAIHVLSLAMDQLRTRLGGDLQLGPSDVSALIELYNHPDMRPTDLGAALHIRSAGLTALADRLVRSGFLHRSPDPNDRRGSRLRLSPAGEHAVGWVYTTVTNSLGEDFSPRSDATANVMMELAEALARVTPRG